MVSFPVETHSDWHAVAHLNLKSNCECCLKSYRFKCDYGKDTLAICHFLRPPAFLMPAAPAEAAVEEPPKAPTPPPPAGIVTQYNSYTPL